MNHVEGKAMTLELEEEKSSEEQLLDTAFADMENGSEAADAPNVP